MPDLKITLITVSFNAESTIECCLQSVLAQSFKNIEYIIIDGASTDNTLQIIHKYDRHFQILVSEPDKGIYDAMNKGIKMASGDIGQRSHFQYNFCLASFFTRLHDRLAYSGRK